MSTEKQTHRKSPQNKKTHKDALHALGELGLGSRLKRLSERLMRDVSKVYAELDIEFEARWFSLLYTLAKDSPKSVTGLADSLGLTHVAITHTAAEMSEVGLIKSTRDRKDERRRLLSLTAKGKALVGKLQPIWKEIRRATTELIDESDTDFMGALGRVEERLDRLSMSERILTGKKGDATPAVKIVDYRPAYKKHFKALNLEWITAFFKVEPIDEELLSDPNGKIIRRGGAILYALVGEKVAGTCALIKHDEDNYELSKMAVSPEFQGFGIGRALGEAIIKRSKELGASSIFLLTHHSLHTAIGLYRKLGFTDADRSVYHAEKYERCTVAMELKLGKQRRNKLQNRPRNYAKKTKALRGRT
jgi:ribosomal protein S18 acetylase RimI-like enzyme/DNA-binding MarR family transcriptional regulator